MVRFLVMRMEEERLVLLNENDHEIKGNITRPKRTGKFPLVVIAHDLLDNSETSYIKECAKWFLDHGMAVARFDFTHGFGKSGGLVEHATISQRARDLELVIQECRRKKYVFDNKISVLAFGFGAMATLAMEGFKFLCKAIILVNTPSAIDETVWTAFPEREMMRVRLKRYFHIQRNGEQVRMNSTFFEDGIRLDLFRCVRNLKTPVLYMHSAENKHVALYHLERLAERTNAKTETTVLGGAGHELGKKQVILVSESTFAFLKKQRAI